MQNELAVLFFAHLDTRIWIPCKQGPDEGWVMDSEYGEGGVVQIVCHLFVTAALSNPWWLDRPTAVFFQI